MEKEEGMDAEAEEAEAFRRKHLPPSHWAAARLEACITLETDSGQKKPLEMNGA